MLQYYTNVRPEMKAFVSNRPGRVLEIGCGAGCFRANFDEVEYWGVEPCAEPALAAAKKLTRVLHGTFEEVASEVPDGYFDLVVCNDVIEHMRDPKDFLSRIGGKLSVDGILIASLPNLRSAVVLFDLLLKGDFRYVDSGILDYTHLHLFTMKSFCRMAVECGWKVEVCRPINAMPFKLLKRLVLFFARLFIPEIGFLQFAVRLRPQSSAPHRET